MEQKTYICGPDVFLALDGDLYTCSVEPTFYIGETMELPTTMDDKVVLKGIRYEAVVGLDVWHRPNKSQPFELEVQLSPREGLFAAAEDDNVAYTIDYGKLYKALNAAILGNQFASVHELYQAIKGSLPDVKSWQITLSFPKAILSANNGLRMTWNGVVDENGISTVMQTLKIDGLDCRCIIGVNSHERLEKQRLLIGLSIWGIENRLSPSMLAGVNMDPSPALAYQGVADDVVERVSGSSYETIEALATAIAQVATMTHGFENARVTIEKPGGVSGLGASGVDISRTRSFFENKDFWKVKRP